MAWSATIQKVQKNGADSPISIIFASGHGLGPFGSVADLTAWAHGVLDNPEFMQALFVSLAIAKGINNPAVVEGKTLTLDLTKPLNQLLLVT
jgi:hypothetical protein